MDNSSRRRRPDSKPHQSEKDVDEDATSSRGSADQDFGNDRFVQQRNKPSAEATESSFGLLKVAVVILVAVLTFIMIRHPEYLRQLMRSSSDKENIQRKGSKVTVDAGNNVAVGKSVVNGVTLYTKEELAKFSGEDPNLPVLLAYMGRVYDVSKGRRHYGPKGSYHFFSGRDATRSFLSGDFKNDLNDNLDGIPDSYYGQIESWADTYAKSDEYKEVGVLCGAFYQCVGDPEPGKPTEKLLHVQRMISKAKAAEAKENEIYTEFPQCNSEWSQDNGGRIWCSEKSGGIDRSWTGVPRLFLMQKDGKKSTRCACVHRDKLHDPRLELYPNCHPDAESCKMQQQ